MEAPPAPELVPEVPSPRRGGAEDPVAAGTVPCAAGAAWLAGSLSAEAPEFTPGIGPAAGTACSWLPPEHRQLLRWGHLNETGTWVAYYVGTLRSFNSQTGYGFIECKQARSDWSSDVFIHKNLVPSIWCSGQPVEFAVVCNARGQPQAWDVNWLPPLPLARPHRPEAKAGTEAEAVSGTAEFELPVRQPRYLGQLKSFSLAQGYGFIDCEQLPGIPNQRRPDVYLDREQLSVVGTGFFQGQAVEFGLAYNAREQPQARQVDVDPVPTLPPTRAEKEVVTEFARKQRTYMRETIQNLSKLLGLLNDGACADAVVAAVEIQGGAAEDLDVDYVTFVLDRLGVESQAAALLRTPRRDKRQEDFAKLVLLLMLSKMLRNETRASRWQQMTRWVDALAKSIDPDRVPGEFQEYVDQVELHFRDLHNKDQMHLLMNALARLREHAAPKPRAG